jgi:acyl CoA:acetate/3-ketoacid CoA transferase beta subunit
VQLVVTDLGILRPDPVTCELVMTALHPGVTRQQAIDATGWPLQFSDACEVTDEPTDHELATLAALRAA